MGFLGKSLSIINSLRLTPGRMNQEMKKNFKIALTGSKDWVNSFYEVLTKDMQLEVSAAEREEKIREFVTVHPSPLDEEARRAIKSDLLIHLLSLEDVNNESLAGFRTLFKLNSPAFCFIEEPQDEEKKLEIIKIMQHEFVAETDWLPAPSEEEIARKSGAILHLNPSFDVSLAYRFPILREAMARKLTAGTANQNMIIALASSLPTNLPIIGVIIGLLAVAGETAVLTMNQVKLCLQLAGLYGQDLNLIDRLKELWPVVGSAFGLRTIARGLVGFVPLAGPTIKAAIAYGGTVMVGEGARWYYQTGKKLNKDEQRNLFEQAKKDAMDKAQAYIDKFKIMKAKKEEREEIKIENLEQGLIELERKMEELEETPPENISPVEKPAPELEVKEDESLEEKPASEKAEPEIKPEPPKTEPIADTPPEKPVDLPADAQTKIIEEPGEKKKAPAGKAPARKTTTRKTGTSKAGTTKTRTTKAGTGKTRAKSPAASKKTTPEKTGE